MATSNLKVGQTVKVRIGKTKTGDMYYIGTVKDVSSPNRSDPVVALVKIEEIHGGLIEFDPILESLLAQLNHDHPKGLPVRYGEVEPLSPIEELVIKTGDISDN